MIPTRFALSFSSAFSGGAGDLRVRVFVRFVGKLDELRGGKFHAKQFLELSGGCQWRGPMFAPALATRR